MPAERGAGLGMRADAPPAVQQRGHRETPRRLRGERHHSEGEHAGGRHLQRDPGGLAQGFVDLDLGSYLLPKIKVNKTLCQTYRVTLQIFEVLVTEYLICTV